MIRDVVDSKKTTKVNNVLLVVTNLVILLISLFLDLGIYDILLIFWLETAIISLFFVLKLPFIIGILTIFVVPPFIAYTAIFMIVYLMFLGMFFSEISDPQFMEAVRMSGDIFYTYWYTILILFVNHIFSYLFNFIKNKEYIEYKNNREKVKNLVFKLYKRMLFMHFSMVMLGFLGVFLGLNSILTVFIIIIYKTIFDLNPDVLNFNKKKDKKVEFI
jgi:hypothetical protein